MNTSMINTYSAHSAAASNGSAHPFAISPITRNGIGISHFRAHNDSRNSLSTAMPYGTPTGGTTSASSFHSANGWRGAFEIHPANTQYADRIPSSTSPGTIPANRNFSTENSLSSSAEPPPAPRVSPKMMPYTIN